ncbi:MAG: hypothetical protein J5449_04765 [Oscillospiraceae bacterium]|nr:hypothetical protein [Oscillospiraceae bacterium]
MELTGAATEWATEKLFGGNPVYDSDVGLVNRVIYVAINKLGGKEAAAKQVRKERRRAESRLDARMTPERWKLLRAWNGSFPEMCMSVEVFLSR